jgi:hypothetical protein
MSRREADADETTGKQRDDRIPDLDVPEHVDVLGGALNTYIATVQGEKQSDARG